MWFQLEVPLLDLSLYWEYAGARVPCFFRQEAFRVVPIHRFVIYTIYLFLVLGPLANCMSQCWIGLEFTHALFSLQLNYLCI